MATRPATRTAAGRSSCAPTNSQTAINIPAKYRKFAQGPDGVCDRNRFPRNAPSSIGATKSTPVSIQGELLLSVWWNGTVATSQIRGR